MSERLPFFGKSATDFDEVKLVSVWKPPDTNLGQDDWRVGWSPAGHYFGWSNGNSSVTLLPWDPIKRCVTEEVVVSNKRYLNQTIQTGRPVRAFTLGSSETGAKADFGENIKGSNKNHVVADKNWFRYHKVEGLVLATGCMKGQIKCWNVHTGQLIMELSDHKAPILDLKFAPDGSLNLASCSSDGQVKLWDLTDDGNMYKTLQPKGYKGHVYACAWAPDAKALVTVGQMGMAILWEIEDDKVKQKHSLPGHQHSVVDCSFSPDGGLLVTASLDSRAILWNPYLCRQLREFRHLYPPPSLIYASGANAAGVLAASFCADGQHLTTICEDKYLRVWSIYQDRVPVQIILKTEPGPTLCDNSPDGSTLVSGPYNGGISFFLPVNKAATLAQLCRSRINVLLRQSTPCTQLSIVIDKLVSEGYLPRDLQAFVQYKTL